MIRISQFMACLPLLLLTGCREEIRDAEAKIIVQQMFVYSAGDKNDSLEAVLPVLNGATPGNYFNVRLADLNRIVGLEGVPDTSRFILSTKSDLGPSDDEFVLIFKPQTDSLKIDSIAFLFHKYYGLGMYRVYSAGKLNRTEGKTLRELRMNKDKGSFK